MTPPLPEPLFTFDDDAASPPKPGLKHVYVADGSHAGLRWYVQRDAITDMPFVTVTGWIEGEYRFNQVDMPGASRASVQAFAESEAV